MKLLKEEITVIGGFLRLSAQSELSGAELFKVCFKLNKQYTKEEVRASLKELLAGFKSASSTIKRRVTNINNLALAFKEYKVVVNFDNLYMYNIKAIVSLLKRVHEHHIKEIIKALKGAYVKGTSTIEYNESIKKVLDNLNEEYGFTEEPTEVTDKVINTFVKDKLGLMTLAQIEALMTSLEVKKAELLKA